MVDFQLLSKGDTEEIHGASLEVLMNTGVMVKNDSALKLLKDAGCAIEGNIVRMPSSLVEESIKKTPPSFPLSTRDGDKTYNVGGSNVIYNPGSAAIFFIDRQSGEMRRAFTKDFLDLVRLTDALEYIHAQSTAMVPGDVPEIVSDLYRLYVILENSTKPIITGAFTKEGLLDMKKMLEAGMITQEGFNEFMDMPGPEYLAPVIAYLATEEAAGITGKVIACGGGIVLNRINIDRLRKESMIVLLNASPRVILKRVADSDARPLLRVSELALTIRELLRFRKPFYERAADITINTSKMDIDSVTGQIIDKVRQDENLNLSK